MSDKKKDIDVRFKFSLDAKPLGEMTKQLGGVSASLAEAKTGASGFAEVLAKTQARVKELGASGKLDILPGGADTQAQKAAAQIDLIAVKLSEVEAKAEAAGKKLAGVAEGTAEWDQANARLKAAELASEQTAVALREALAASAAGVQVDVLPMQEVTDLSVYRAVVVGSAIQDRQWLPEAVELLVDP